MYDIILAFLTAFIITYFIVPSIINVAKVKRLYDIPDERRSHTVITPSLGGIAIFAGLVFSIVFWTPFDVFGDLQYILCALVIIFLIGAKDDVLPIKPQVKLIGQLAAASIIAFKAEITFTSLYGLFGITTIPLYVSIPLTILTIIMIINAFNLIDGINGLAGSIASLVSFTLGTWFLLVDRIELAIMAFSLLGATIAFLKYNFTPAKIFMGDTGSLLLGLICAILMIEFIDYNRELSKINHEYAVDSGPAVAIGILVLPIFDTIRVFITRILNGKSPFYPDRTHIHHLLLDTGLSHMQATGLLFLVNIGFILLVYFLQGLGNLNLLLLLLGIATFLSTSLYLYVTQEKVRNAV